MKNKYLATLELSPGATKKDIKIAYRNLSKKYHPDINPNPDAHEKFIAIAEAYNFLTKVGPTPGNQKTAYDYNPFEASFEQQRNAAKARAKQRARDLARMQQQTIKRALYIFKQSSIVIILFNVLLAIDYVLPRKPHHQVITHVEMVYQNVNRRNYEKSVGGRHVYDEVHFEDFVMRFKADEVVGLPITNQATVMTTFIFQKPMQAMFIADGEPIIRNQILGVFKVFGALIPAILIMAVFYHFIIESLDTRLSIATVLVVFFLIQLFIYIKY